MPDTAQETHDPAQLVERKIPGWMAFGINLLVFGIESGYLYWVLREGRELESFLLLHFGVVLLLSGWHYWCLRTYQAYLFPTFTLVFVTALGPLGALGMAYTTLARAWLLRGKPPFGELMHVLFPADSGKRSNRLYDQLSRMEPSLAIEEGLAPLANIIARGTQKQKQAALLLMMQHYQPLFTPILKQALHDKDPNVRAMAATAISRIEIRMNEEAQELEGELNFDYNEENLISLAVHYDQYAWSDLLDPAQTERCRKRALDYYSQYLKRQPRDVSVYKEVGRLHYRSGQLDQAGAWFDQHREKANGSLPFLAWDLEVLYEQGRFDKVRELIAIHGQKLLQADGYPFAINDTLKLWLGSQWQTGGDA